MMARAIKSITVDDLPADTWRIIGGSSTSGIGALGAYRVVPIIYRCARLRAKSVQSFPIALYRGNTDISDTDEGLSELARIRNLLYLFELSLVVYGRAHALRERGRLTRSERLRWIASPGIAPRYDATHGLIGYTRNGQSLDVEQVITAWLQDPSVDVGPDVSPAAVALRAAGVLDNIDTFLEKFFDGGAIKATLLQIQGNVAEPEKKKLEAWWKKALSGVKNAFNAAAVSAAVTPIPIGDSIEDTINVDLNEAKLNDVLIAMEVPASLVLANAANYATAVQDSRSFYSQCVIPETQLIVDALNTFYNQQGLDIWLLPERVEAFQEAELAKAKSLADVTGSPVLTQSEARQRLSLPPLAADAVEARRLELAAQLTLAQQMVDFGYSVEQAAELAGLPAPIKDAEPIIIEQLPPPPAQLPPPEAEQIDVDAMRRADLERWQRKAIKRGGVCSFESVWIDPSEAELITHRLERARDKAAITAAFKIGEPGADLTPQEQALFDVLKPLLSKYGAAALNAILAGEPFDSAAFSDALRAALLGELATIALASLGELSEVVGPEFDVGQLATEASTWARTYTYDLVQNLTTTTQQTVQNAAASFLETPGMTRAQLEMLLSGAFSARRAESIAITEVTRAASAATSMYQSQLTAAGLTFVRVWHADNDDRVCPICGPLDGKKEDVWADRFPGGPPAHVRCRCSTTLEFVRTP